MTNLQLNQLGDVKHNNLKPVITNSEEVTISTTTGLDHIIRLSNIFSSTQCVKPHFRGKEGLANCIIALAYIFEKKKVFMEVFQGLNIINGTVSWSAQYLISQFNKDQRYTSIQFKFTGEKGKDSWGCIAYSKNKETGETIYGPEVTIEMAKNEGWYGKNGSKWRTMPEMMLRYRSASYMIRTCAPEIVDGIVEETEVYDMQEDTQGNYTVAEVKNAYVPHSKPIEENKPAPKKTTAKKEPVQVQEVAESEKKRKQQAQFADDDLDDDEFYKNSK